MRRPRFGRFGGTFLQTGDWKPWAIGVLSGILTLVSLWRLHATGVPLDGQKIIVLFLVSMTLGVLLLLYGKETWARPVRWLGETLGFILVGPMMVVISCFICPLFPSDFAGPKDPT